MKSSPLPCCVLPNFVSFHAALPPGIAFSFSAHSSPSSSSIFPGLLCRFRIISSGSLAALPPYCCLCTLCPIPLFPAAYLQDFSDNFRFIQSVSLAALPLLLPLRSLPNSSLSSSISSRLLCRFSLHSISFTGCFAPFVAFAFSAPFLSFKQHISRTSLSISSHSISSTGCFTPYYCLCALYPIPLFPAAYLQDFSDDFRFIQSMSLAALPVLLPLSSLPHSSLSSSISSRLLYLFLFHSISFTSCFAPFVAFAFSTPFLSFQQHISRTSVDFRRFLSVYYLQNFSAAYPLFPGISISPPLLSQLRVFTSGTPVCFASRCCLCFMLLPLPSLPDSSLSNSISLCPFSLPAFLPDVAFRSSA